MIQRIHGVWVCWCGNRDDLEESPLSHFYPVTREGEPVDPWEEAYEYWACCRCGLIFHERTLEVIGTWKRNISLSGEVLYHSLKGVKA